MRRKNLIPLAVGSLLGLGLAFSNGPTYAGELREYAVTIENLAGQPLSRAVAATHRANFRNVVPVAFTFTGTPEPGGDGTLTVTAARDLNNPLDFITVFGEQGVKYGILFSSCDPVSGDCIPTAEACLPTPQPDPADPCTEILFDASDFPIPCCGSHPGGQGEQCVVFETDVAATDAIPRAGNNLACNGPTGMVPQSALAAATGDGSVTVFLYPSVGVGLLRYFSLDLTYLGYSQTIDSAISVLQKRTSASARMFQVGEPASAELEAQAVHGKPEQLFTLFESATRAPFLPARVTDRVIGKEIPPGETDTQMMKASPGERLSLVTKLGSSPAASFFTGLSVVGLPGRGSRTFSVVAHEIDAGGLVQAVDGTPVAKITITRVD